MKQVSQFGIKSALAYLERIVEICEDQIVTDLNADENDQTPSDMNGWALGVIWQKTKAAIEILERLD